MRPIVQVTLGAPATGAQIVDQQDAASAAQVPPGQQMVQDTAAQRRIARRCAEVGRRVAEDAGECRLPAGAAGQDSKPAGGGDDSDH